MSQPSSSIISADNAEIKYKKALKEISKLISANRTLRQSNDKDTARLKEKIDQLSLRYEDMQKQYDSVRKEKESFTHYLDEVQKQRKNLEREIAYLNDVVAEQNAELKKLTAHKDQRAVAALIRTYEEKESSMNRTRNQNEEMIAKLKATVEKLEGQLQYEKTAKQEMEDHYKRLAMEMGNYKEQNSSLLSQIERLLHESSEKDAYCSEKEKELRMLANEFQKQIGMLKSVQEQSFKSPRSAENEMFQELLTEKNRQAMELAKMQSAFEEMISREKEYFEMEQKMKSARLQAERANEEVNMLKSKIIVLEAKEFLEEAGDDDYDQKFFEERLNLLVAQNDPLNSIKNHEDSSHFRILKSFIVDLQDKVYKATSEKKEVSRKYKSIKAKFIKNAQELSHFEEQNKLMKGKLEGYERLTEKLQFELERALSGNEQQITRMTITSNNLITKKVEEYRSSIQLLNSQLEMNQDKASRTEKNYKQEIETLRLELDTLRIRYKDETDKTGKDSELIELYKKKNSDLSNRINALEDQLAANTENMNKFEHLFKEQKGKNEGLLAQKQQLLAQTRQLSEEADKKTSTFNTSFKVKEDQYEFEIRKLRTDNQKMKDELEYNAKEVKNLQRDLEEMRRGDQGQFSEIKRLTQRNSDLEGKIVELKRSIRSLEDEIETNKIKNKKFQESYEKTVKFEEENLTKNDKINDLTRQKILLESQIKNLQSQLNEEAKQNEEYKKELSNLKMKNLEVSHESKRQFESKFLESKKIIQTLNQEISDLTTELRDQKSKNLRTANELTTLKAEKNRLQDLADQNRKRDLQSEGQVSNIKLELSNLQMEIERLQSEVKKQQSISNGYNIEIETLQQKIFAQNQELSNLKMKLESAEDLKNDLVKDLNSLKFNFPSVESHANQAKANINLSWPEQSFLSGVSEILLKIRKICRNYGVAIESSGTITSTVTTTTTAYAPAVDTSYVPVKNPSQGKAAGGNTYLQFFKSYADSGEDQGSSYRPAAGQGEATRNFESNIGTTQSIGLSKTDYNYSGTSFGNAQGYTASGNESWNKPSYDFGAGKNNYSQFNYSAFSKAGQE